MKDKTELEQVNEILERLEWCDYDDIDFGRGFEEYAPLVKQALTEKRDRLTTGEWPDIKSAPKDGTPIIGFDGCSDDENVYIAYWDVNKNVWLDTYEEIQVFLTHWQPLPTGEKQ